jgi:RecB family exonuclease
MVEKGPEQSAYRVSAGPHVFEFRGRIDRIDLSDDRRRARVIDYKVGRLPDSMRRLKTPPLMAGEKVQLAVYRGALGVCEDLASVERVEGEYLYLQPRDGEVVRHSFDDDRLRTANERLPGLLEVIGSLIEQGAFFARTQGSTHPNGHCRYCDYLAICGKDRIQREERKSGDPLVQRFAALARIDGEEDRDT